jgi:hypothetical protein
LSVGGREVFNAVVAGLDPSTGAGVAHDLAAVKSPDVENVYMVAVQLTGPPGLTARWASGHRAVSGAATS